MRSEKPLVIIMLVIALVTAAVGFSGCVTQQANTIIVGTNAFFPPFEFYDENHTIVGFDIELVTKILTDAGYTVEVQNMEFDSLQGALETGTINVIAAAMTITEERSEAVDFTMPYFDSNQSVLINLNNNPNLTIQSAADFVNVTKVGAQRGTTGEYWIQDNLITPGIINETQYEPYTLYTNAVTELNAGRLDAVVLDTPVAKVFDGINGDNISMNIITNEQYGFAVQKGNATLLAVLNDGLESLMGTDYWTTLEQKYFEQEWIITEE